MNIHYEILVEEPSCEAFIGEAWPRISPAETTCRIHSFNGRHDLLSELPKRLRGYSKWIPEHYRIVVLIDEDRNDCTVLKALLEQISTESGFTTLSSLGSGAKLANRIAVEELEAWFLGDPEGLRQAFPKVSRTFEKEAAYRYPDAIKGGTWESLERLLQRAGYYQGGLAKIDCARRMAPHIDRNRNRSRSFQIFIDTLTRLIEHPALPQEMTT
jgi:hypothetical protein